MLGVRVTGDIGGLGLEVVRPGRIAVLESASETTHYPKLNRAAFGALTIPWLVLEHFDESQLDELLARPLEDRFAAVVVTPGAMALPQVRTAIASHSESFSRALAQGVGVVITATTLGGAERFDLTFVPEAAQVALVETGMRRLLGTATSDELPALELSEAAGTAASSGVTLTASQAFGWTHAIEVTDAAGAVEAVAWRAQFGRGRVIVSALPVERIGWVDVLQRMLTRASRGRGYLVLGSTAAPDWYGHVAPGEFLVRLPGQAASAGLTALADDFSHLRICRDAAGTRLPSLDRATVLARLENDGTVEFPSPGPGIEVYSRMQGAPQYLRRLREAQDQLLPHADGMPTSPTFHVLAMCLLSRAAIQVVQGRLFVPDLFRRRTVRSIVATALARRVSRGSVDGLLLPTVNLLVVGHLTDADPATLEAMTSWVAAHADQAADDQRAQARWAAHAGDRPDLLDLIPQPEADPGSLLGRLAGHLDAGDLAAVPPSSWSSLNWAAPAAGSTDPTLQDLTALDAAILAYSYARWAPAVPSAEVWGLLEATRDEPGAHAVNVEEYCYRVAAQVLLDDRAPLSVHHAPATTPAVPQLATRFLEQQASVEIAQREAQSARDELQRVIGSARVMAGILSAIVGAAALTLVSMPLWLPAAAALDLGVRLTIAAGIFVAVSAVGTLTIGSDLVGRVAPKWVQRLGDVVRAVRN